jgi:sec-independent protein translocase protein TatB
MFDIGGLELLIIGIIALIVVGPKDLPRLVRSVSSIIGKIKSLSNELRSGLNDLAREVDVEEFTRDADLDPFKDLREEEGLKPGMTPDQITKKILSNQTKKVSRTATVKLNESEKTDSANE